MQCELCSCVNESHRLIYQNEHVFAVVCKWPLKPGHILILPKKHITSLSGLTGKEATELFSLADKVSDTLAKIYEESPIMVKNFGVHSSESHLHLHILPVKGSLRKLISQLESVPERFLSSEEQEQTYRNKILECW